MGSSEVFLCVALRKSGPRLWAEATSILSDKANLFRDANVSGDAMSALKHFRCDACESGSESCRDLQ